MDLTKLVTTSRDLAPNDPPTYRHHLSRQIATLRRRLTPTRATKTPKYTAKPPITAALIGTNPDHARLLVLGAERAWAHAMHIKTQHTTANKPLTGRGRRHMLSRLGKARRIAQGLAAALEARAESGASATDVLEAVAYAFVIAGGEEFERRATGARREGEAPGRWALCVGLFSAARVAYAALLGATAVEVFKEVLAGIVDPGLRYAAQQALVSRTLPLGEVARMYFPKERGDLLGLVQEVDGDVLREQSGGTAPKSAGRIPTTIEWGGRKANIVDGSIGQALAAVGVAEEKLVAFLDESDGTSRDKAGAYDGVIMASQDAVDATRRAIDELEKEHGEEGDSRMQNLRITSLAVNYDVVAWRVGRNRMLIGQNDGVEFETEQVKSKKRKRAAKEPKEEPTGRKLARLRERVHLYDEILQSVDSVKELRGAVRDAAFVQELDSKRGYFHALKCLNIAYSHALIPTPKNALALFLRAEAILSKAMQASKSTSQARARSPLKLDVSKESFGALHARVQMLIKQYRGVVELHNIDAKASMAAQKTRASAPPMVEWLHDYPAGGVDLTNLVTYPPKVKAVPVKPILLDVAWNYIDYASQKGVASAASARVNGAKEADMGKEKKTGWFGFGR